MAGTSLACHADSTSTFMLAPIFPAASMVAALVEATMSTAVQQCSSLQRQLLLVRGNVNNAIHTQAWRQEAGQGADSTLQVAEGVGVEQLYRLGEQVGGTAV